MAQDTALTEVPAEFRPENVGPIPYRFFIVTMEDENGVKKFYEAQTRTFWYTYTLATMIGSFLEARRVRDEACASVGSQRPTIKEFVGYIYDI